MTVPKIKLITRGYEASGMHLKNPLKVSVGGLLGWCLRRELGEEEE